MHAQYTVYDNDAIVFVETMHRATKIPGRGEVVHFPECEKSNYCRVVDVIWHMYQDSDPLVEIVLELCLDPKCKESRTKA